MGMMALRRAVMAAGLNTNLAPPLSQWESGFINSAGGVSSAGATVKEKTSPYVPVSEGQGYKFSYTLSATPKYTYWAAICFYNASMITIDSRISPGESNTKYDIVGTAPEGAKYIRMSFRSYGIATSATLTTV